MITLYGPRITPFTEKVMRGLALKKLAFVLVEPESAKDYHRWNPATGLLPVIDIDGERIHDSTAILLRLDEAFPEPSLLCDHPRTADNQLRLVRWVDETFFWYWNRWMRRVTAGTLDGPPVAGESLTEATSRAAEAELPRPEGVSLRSWVASRVRKRPEPEKPGEPERLVHEVGHRVADLARLLGPRPFFYADRISIADLAAYAMLRTIAADSIPNTREHLERHPALLEFMKRVERKTGGASGPSPEPARLEPGAAKGNAERSHREL
ncbi:MAG: glutathione S-transferase family protein [Myxococcota bacterium]